MYQYIENCKFIIENLISSYVNDYKNYEMPIYIIDNTGKYIYVNNMFLKLLNIKDEENVGKGVEAVLGPKNIKHFHSIKQSVIESKTKKSFNEHIFIDGKEMIWRVNSVPILDDEGRCNKCFNIAKISYKKDFYTEINHEYGNLHDTGYSVIADYNERKEDFIYEELYEYMQEICNDVPVEGMSIWTYDDKYKTIKKRICSGIIRDTFDEIEMPFDEYAQEYIMRNNENLFYPIPIKSYEKYFIDNGFKDSYDRCLSEKYIMYLPIIYDEKILGILNLYFSKGHISDEEYAFIKRVTKRMALCLKNIQLFHSTTNQLHEELKLQNNFNRYLKSSIDLYIILDINLNIRTVSPSIIQLLGWRVEEMKDQKVTEFAIIDSKDIMNEENDKNKYNTRVYIGPCKARCKDGTLKDIDIYYYIDAINNEIVLTGQDLTDINQLKAKTKFLQQEIEKEKIKNEFITNISHEFRTPLNLILSAIQLEEFKNRDKVINEGKLDSFALIKQNSYRLLRLSNNIIDITAINSNCIKLNYANLNIISCIRELSKYVNDYCKNIKRNFSCDLDDVNVTLACDKDKIEKVVLNLLSNAIKYTKEGGNIILGGNVDRKSNRLYMWVQDDGCGIPKENYESVFSSFTQVDDILSRRAEGSGIGLALCKAFVEMHGGKIYIQPLKKYGAKIVFYIPITILENCPISRNSVILTGPKTNVEIEFSDIYM